MSSPSSKVILAGGKVKLLKKFLGDFEIGDVYSVIPGFSASLAKKHITKNLSS